MACCLNLSISFAFCLSQLGFFSCVQVFLNNKDTLAIWGRGRGRGGMIYLVPLLSSLSCSIPWRFSEQWVVKEEKLRPAGTEGFGSVWTQAGRCLWGSDWGEPSFWAWSCSQSPHQTSLSRAETQPLPMGKKNSLHFSTLPSFPIFTSSRQDGDEKSIQETWGSKNSRNL